MTQVTRTYPQGLLVASAQTLGPNTKWTGPLPASEYYATQKPQKNQITESSIQGDLYPLGATTDDSIDVITEKLKTLFDSTLKNHSTIHAPFGSQLELYPIGKDYWVKPHAIAFVKPGLASDLCMVSVNESAKTAFALLGIRKFPPGAGNPAWLGGFCEVKPAADAFVYDSYVYTAVKEAREEARVKIKIEDKEALRRDYNFHKATVSLSYDGKEQKAKLVALGVVETGKTELHAPTQKKRVYATAGYACIVKGEDNFFAGLKAGDDIGDLRVVDISKTVFSESAQDMAAALKEKQKEIGFGIDHHNRLLELLAVTVHNRLVKAGTATSHIKQKHLDAAIKQ